MRIFKTRWFDLWARKTGLSDRVLAAAVNEMERGLVGDALGGFVFKKRVALPGKGKRGGSRTLVVYRRGAKAFFVYGYLKSKRENIGPEVLGMLKRSAAELLSEPPEELQQAIRDGGLVEVNRNG